MLNSKPSSKWNYTKIISLFFHLPAVVWTTRWTIVKICSVIVRISSELVEISSEPVEISSELVWNSSELVSTILELLIISVFRKRPNRFHTRSFRLAMKLKANPFISPLFTCLLNPLCAPEAAKCFPFQSDWKLYVEGQVEAQSQKITVGIYS